VLRALIFARSSPNSNNQRARLVAKDILETAVHLSKLLDGILAVQSKKKNAVRSLSPPNLMPARDVMHY
jgi:hypothetical protein